MRTRPVSSASRVPRRQLFGKTAGLAQDDGGMQALNSMLHLAQGGGKPAYRELQSLGDEDVMLALKAGADDALAVLFARYHRLVFSIALRIVRDEGEAEDVTQTVFFDVFRAAAQFDPSKGTTKMWLLQYAYHRAMSRKRHLNVRRFYDRDSEAPSPELPEHRPGFSPGSIELGDLVRKGLASLGEAQRSVIESASFDGLTMKEIAQKTGESLVNVRHHYYRGLRKLRVFVEQYSQVNSGAGHD